MNATPDSRLPIHRIFYWSIRREVWENRSVYIAPLIVAGVTLIGFALSMIRLAARRRAIMVAAEAARRNGIAEPYDMVAILLLATAFIVGAFYCLDALYGERRDRSIFFWKSLPVSDATTVFAKAAMPLVILPSIVFVLSVVTQLIMFAYSSMILLASGLSPAVTWKYFPIFQQSLLLVYGLVVIALWHAPVYTWLLLISAWVKRAAFLWAVLPFFALAILEQLASKTHVVLFAMQYRLLGFTQEAFSDTAKGSIYSASQLTPWRFLTSGGLWIGLAFAVTFLGITVRMRRYREPI
ncbi:MAG TPA: ABC transporter permease [Thermoanaerobaculia bacterium]|jgi:ABC-2 type transport system permease protein|nr:ABC transporter permease [Thermoanaerobaculia bacterium]